MIVKTKHGLATISTIGICSAVASSNDKFTNVGIMYENSGMNTHIEFNNESEAEVLIKELDKHIDKPVVVNSVKEKSDVELFKEAIEYALKLKDKQ